MNKFPELKTLPTQEEVDALRAQVEALLEPAKEAAEALGFASHHLRGRVSENMLMDMAEKADALISAIGSTPAQCLAEIKVKAIEDAKHSCEKRLLVVVDSHTGEQDFITCCESNDLSEYADQIRQSSKEQQNES